MITEAEQITQDHEHNEEDRNEKSELGKRDREENDPENIVIEESASYTAKKLKDESNEASENANGNIQHSPDASILVVESNDQVIVANESENIGNVDAINGYLDETAAPEITETPIADIHVESAPNDSATDNNSQTLTESKLFLNELIEKTSDESNTIPSLSKTSKHIAVMPVESDSGDVAMLEVSPEKVGSIIGSKGSVIQEIQLKSGAKVIVDQNFPDGVNRVVKITGNPNQVKAAVEYVIKVVEEGPSSIHVGVPQGSQVTTIIECPQQLVGRVIGGSGHVIKDIQSRTNAKVVIDQNFPEGVPRKIIVTGNHQAVANATNLINYVMQHGPNLPPANTNQSDRYQPAGNVGFQQQMSRPSPYEPQPQVIHVHQPVQYAQHVPSYMPQIIPQPTTVIYGADMQQKTIEVAKQFVGRIIGKGGSHVVSIGKQSGCQIRIDQEREPCRVNITGPAAGIALAETMIQEVMLNIRNPPPLSGQPQMQMPTMQNVSASTYGIMVPNYVGSPPTQSAQLTSYGQFTVPSPQSVGTYTYPINGPTQAYAVAPGHYTPATSVPSPYMSNAVKPPSSWNEYKTNDGKSYWHNPSTGVTQVKHA